MKKTACAVICIVFSFFIIASVVIPSSASGGSLTAAEAKQIILNAFKFYYKYQFSEMAITLKREDISAEAKEIYANEIADDMWMKRCYGSKDRELYSNLCGSLERLKNGSQQTAPGCYEKAVDYYQKQLDLLFGNNGLTFVDNGNGTVTIQPFASEIMDWRQFKDSYYGVNIDSQYKFWQVVISKEYSSDFFSQKIRPSIPDDIEIRSLSGGNDKASCEVLIYARVIPEPNIGGVTDYRPVWANVEFSLTGGKWRICGGDIIPALSDWSVIAGKTLKSDVTVQHRSVFCPSSDFESGSVISRSNHLLDAIPRTIILPGLLEVFPESSTSLSDGWYQHGNHMFINAGEFRFVSQSGNVAVYEVEYISWTAEFGENYIGETDQFKRVYVKSYGTHTAEFTYDPEYTYTYLHYPHHPFTGAWRLTGGEWYDILTGKSDKTPNTGDSNTYLIIVLSLSGVLCLAVIYEKKKKEKPASLS